MKIVTPAFRAIGQNYYFVADDRGCIRAVVYPNGDRFLRISEAD
jgi:hypothetical protein